MGHNDTYSPDPNSFGAPRIADLGSRLEAWKKQRAQLAAEIRSIVAEGQKILTELGRPETQEPGHKRKGGRPKGYRMSEATRAKLRAAWRKRKALMKRG
jgi:hypothetical protein